jgi:hypothetical protein
MEIRFLFSEGLTRRQSFATGLHRSVAAAGWRSIVSEAQTL